MLIVFCLLIIDHKLDHFNTLCYDKTMPELYDYQKDPGFLNNLKQSAPGPSIVPEKERRVRLTELSWDGDYPNDPAVHQRLHRDYEIIRGKRFGWLDDSGNPLTAPSPNKRGNLLKRAAVAVSAGILTASAVLGIERAYDQQQTFYKPVVPGLAGMLNSEKPPAVPQNR